MIFGGIELLVMGKDKINEIYVLFVEKILDIW